MILPPVVESTVSCRTTWRGSACSPKLLHNGAKEGNLNSVEEAIREGAELNHCDHGGKCALHYASGYGHVSVVQRLLERRAEVNLADTSGWTPVDDAEYWSIKLPSDGDETLRLRCLNVLGILRAAGGVRSNSTDPTYQCIIQSRRERLEKLAKKRGFEAPWGSAEPAPAFVAGPASLPPPAEVCGPVTERVMWF